MKRVSIFQRLISRFYDYVNKKIENDDFVAAAKRRLPVCRNELLAHLLNSNNETIEIRYKKITRLFSELKMISDKLLEIGSDLWSECDKFADEVFHIMQFASEFVPIKNIKNVS